MTHIHAQGDKDDDGVEVEQRLIFCHAIRHQFAFDQIQEVSVQDAVDNEVDGFLNTIPDSVDVNVLLVYLQSCGDPNTIDGDVDAEDSSCGPPFYPKELSLVDDEDGESIDDDLKEALNLEHPAGHYEADAMISLVHMVRTV